MTSEPLIRPEVADALHDGRPVVALESTLIAHGLPRPLNLETARAAGAGVRVFATGGIGGVHPAAAGHPPDVSADLVELARTAVAVVCAGAKSILDLPATLEALETLGVPVLGYGVEEFPAFYLRT